MKKFQFKKTLALLLSFCLLLATMPMVLLSASAADLAPTVDDSGVIHISTPAELAAIGVDSDFPRDGKYVLDNDIDLSNFDADSDYTNGNWLPLCANIVDTYKYSFEDTVAFAGSFDGQGHTISGMEIIDTVNSVAHLGLFAHVTTGAVISNIVFDNCYIEANVGVSVYAGFVAGYCDKNGKTISNIAVLNSSIDATSRNKSNGSGVGSIVGSATQATIKNVYSEADITVSCSEEGNWQFGVAGIAGAAWRGYVTVDSAVFNGTITNNVVPGDYYYLNGIYSLNGNQLSTTPYPTNSERFTNCWYNSDKLTPVGTASEDAIGTNGGHINGEALTSEELASKKLSELGLSGEYWCPDTESLALDITLDDSIASYPGYIPLYDAWDLARIGKDSAYPLDGSYMLMNDIDMADYGNWTPIANTTVSGLNGVSDAAFQGVFNGAGHTIYNLSISASGSRCYLGLFGICYDAQFSNVAFRNANVKAEVSTMGYAGILLGVARVETSSKPYSTTVKNVAVYDSSVTVTNTQIANTTGAGGIVGFSENGIAFYDCYSDADVTASYVGTTGESLQVAAGGFIGMAYDGKITAQDSIFAGTLAANNCTSDYTGEVTEAYKRQNSVLGANNRGISGTSFNTVQQAVATNCYYLDTVTVNPENPRGLDGTAISTDAFKTATADSLGLDGILWRNDGEGLYLAIIPIVLNDNGAIEIDTAEELASIGAYEAYPRDGYYVLTADIDLSSFGNWTPICGGLSATKAVAFCGIFDGQGHTISNMTVEGTADNVTGGLFGALTDNKTNNKTLVKNISFKDCKVDISGAKSVDAAILTGIVDVEDYNWVDVHNVSIIDCTVNGTATQANYSGVGSIAGNGSGLQMENIYSDAELSGGCAAANNNFGMGGLVGRAWRGYSWAKGALFNGTITNNTPDTSENVYANGILGVNWNQTSIATDVDGNMNCYYNSTKLTVSEKTNGGEFNGTALTADEIAIKSISLLGLDSSLWMHDGKSPVLKVSGNEAFVTGDASGDGEVNILDLIRMKKYLAGAQKEIVAIAADLNRDLSIGVEDMAFFRKTLLGFFASTEIDLTDTESEVKLLGKAVNDSRCVVMDWTYTGFEFNAMAEGDVKVSMKMASMNPDYTYARVAVIVDGEYSIINVTADQTEYTIASGLDYGYHTFKVVKISERSKGKIYAYGISFMGKIEEKPADSELTISFYGDSITAGDGVVKNDRIEPVDYIEGQYGDKTYAAKTAEKLGADIRVAARSGIKTVDAVLGLIDAGEWVYTAENAADIVVINLGTNDKSVVYEGGSEATDAGITAEKNAIFDMLDMTRSNHPDAKIVWCYGMMGTPLGEYIEAAITEYAQSDAGVYYCELPANTNGGGNHPDEVGHTAAAKVLASFIEGLIAE